MNWIEVIHFMKIYMSLRCDTLYLLGVQVSCVFQKYYIFRTYILRLSIILFIATIYTT